MPTLLTTSRMSPALAARVEASVRGGSRGGGEGRLLRQAVLGMRILLLLAIVAGIVALVRMRQRESDEVQRSREGLLAKVRAHATALAPEDRRAVARIEPWLVRGSGQYEGDVIAEELKGPGALASFLSRPLVYVHGPTAEFDGPSGIAAAAATSQKDAFLLCLLEPPATRTENALLSRVHGAYAGGPRLEARTSQARRLHETEAGLRFLQPSFEAALRAAKDTQELGRLERSLKQAPIDAALAAARARLLLFVMDEPGDGKGLTELDGERAHEVRVGLVDLSAGRVLLRLRKHVDPSWISLPRRAQYAAGLDQCALAMDVHAHVAGG